MIYLTLIPIFAVLDRWCGGGMGWRNSFRGRPIYYVLPLILIAWHLDQRLGILMLSWCIWREPKWNLFGGSLAPITNREINGTIFRHLLIAPTILVCIGYPAIVWALMFVLLGIWVFWATYLACYNGVMAEDGEDVNWLIESARGAGFGAVAAAVFFIQGIFG